jgi:hypothetical protein
LLVHDRLLNQMAYENACRCFALLNLVPESLTLIH